MPGGNEPRASSAAKPGLIGADNVAVFSSKANTTHAAPRTATADVAPCATTSRLCLQDVTLGYHGAPTVVNDLCLQIPDGKFTAIIGPNGCGKSTVLRALAHTLHARSGQVTLDGKPLSSYRPKQLARQIALLPQAPVCPVGITVADLVARGRFPHQHVLSQWSVADAHAVNAALAEVGLHDAAHRVVDELSGGQRQRAWIALTLAQQTPIILLDEPTTFLDISAQVSILDLCSRLHREHGRTLVAVLHDLNMAARYADHIVAMRAGRVIASGDPGEVCTPAILDDVFGLDAHILSDPDNDRPLVVPRDLRADQPEESNDQYSEA